MPFLIKNGVIFTDNLVGKLILHGGEKVLIRFSSGDTEKAVYKETIGYTNYFVCENGRELKLSNHFMDMKDITVSLDK